MGLLTLMTRVRSMGVPENRVRIGAVDGLFEVLCLLVAIASCGRIGPVEGYCGRSRQSAQPRTDADRLRRRNAARQPPAPQGHAVRQRGAVLNDQNPLPWMAGRRRERGSR